HFSRYLASAQSIGCAVFILLLSVASSALSAGSSAEQMDASPIVELLRQRGLVGGKLTDDKTPAAVPTPAAGTEAEEVRSGKADSDPTTTVLNWSESLGDNQLYFAVANAPGLGSQVTLWVIP